MIVRLLVPSLGIAIGLLGTVTMLVFMAAGCANLKPEQLAAVKSWMWGVGLLGLASCGGAIGAWALGRPMTAAGIGAVPFGALIAMGLYFLILKG